MSHRKLMEDYEKTVTSGISLNKKIKRNKEESHKKARAALMAKVNAKQVEDCLISEYSIKFIFRNDTSMHIEAKGNKLIYS